MDLVVIDSALSEVSRSVVTGNYYEVIKEEVIESNYRYRAGEITHGDIVSRIIQNTSNNSITIHYIKLFQDGERGKVDDLVSALKWCLSNRIEIINLSIGSYLQQDYWKLREIIGLLIQNNCKIIAACNNYGYFTSPANMSGVLGVKAFSEIPMEMVDKPCISGEYVLAQGQFKFDSLGTINANSYAAAYVTAICADSAGEKENSLFIQYRRKLLSYSFFPDFLADTVIVSSVLEDNLSDFFFFKFRIIKSIQEIKKEKGIKYIVFDGVVDEDEVYNFLDQRDEIFGVAVMGKISIGLAQNIRSNGHRLLWTLYEYKRYIKTCCTIQKNKCCSIPVVWINCDGDIESISLAKKAKDTLTKNKYNSVITTTNSIEVLFGFYYNPNIQWGEYLGYLQSYLRLDAVIICDEKERFPEFLADIFVDSPKQIYKIDDNKIEISKETWTTSLELSKKILFSLENGYS